MEGYIAQVLMFASNFAPKNWAYCNGQILPISSNTALFSLIGTYYGGNGTSNFALPDMQGRIPVGVGQGGGLPDYTIGQAGGSELVTLTSRQLPAHTHQVLAQVSVSNGNGNTDAINGNVPAGTATDNYVSPTLSNNALGGVTASSSIVGGTSPVSIIQPYLAVNFIICLYGSFPSRP